MRRGPGHPGILRMLGVGLGALLATSACADESETEVSTLPSTSEPSPGTLLEGRGWRGVLLEADIGFLQLADGTVVDDEVTSFVPEESDVTRFEDELPSALPDASNPSGDEVTVEDLEEYARQYTGVAGAGDRHLVVSAICDDRLDGFPEWERQWIEVSDGGACFWHATMDLASGEIISFGFNGQA